MLPFGPTSVGSALGISQPYHYHKGRGERCFSKRNICPYPPPWLGFETFETPRVTAIVWVNGVAVATGA
jgi:hypothetical protein